MRVYLDGEAVGGEVTNLAEALRSAVAVAERAGRMIVSASADGERLRDDVLASPAAFAGSVQELRLTSADPGALVQDALREAAHLLIEAKSLQGEAAAAFTTGDIAAGSEHLKGVVSYWQSVQDAVAKSSAVLGVALEDLEYSGADGEVRKAREEIAGLAKLLNDLFEALSRQDWSGASDTLDFDLAASADSWGAMIRRLTAVVAERGRA